MLMLRGLRTSALRLLPVLLAARAAFAAQNPNPSAQPELTIRATTTLIQVNVVAHDSSGRSVTGLTRNDFEVFDNGKPQPLAVFTSDAAPAQPAPHHAPGAPATFTNLQSVAGAPGSSVILLDFSNTGFRTTARARIHAARVVEALGPSERIALYTLDRFGLHVLSELGEPRPVLISKLHSAMGQASPCFQNQLDGLGDIDAMASPACAGELKPYYVDKRIRETLTAMESIAGHLAGLPGRKGLIWISSAFPLRTDVPAPAARLFPEAMGSEIEYESEFGNAMRRLNNADVALYPVDPRGVSTESPVANADDFTMPTMNFFAQRTGGQAFHGNDVAEGIRKAVEDVQASYTLGFYAPQDESPRSFHKLAVRSLRPDVTLRYKEGYYAIAPPAKPAATRKQDVARALTALADSTTLPLSVNAARERGGLKLELTLWPARLALTQKGSKWQGEVEFVSRFSTSNGTECASPQMKRIQFNLAQETYSATLQRGMRFSRVLQIPRGAARLRLLIRNPATGETGTVTISLDELEQTQSAASTGLTHRAS
jgi:VWFA-related protein